MSPADNRDTNGPKRVLITGATSGLGREVAIQLGRRGWRIAVTGRRVDALKDTAKLVRDAGGETLLLPGSVTDNDEVRAHYALVKDSWGGLDWCLLNAGVNDLSDAKTFRAETYRWVLDTNVLGVCRWLEAVLPDMVARGSGVVGAVSSLAAFRGLPRSGAYCASKAALVTLLESTRVDLRGTGIDVVTICPGFIKSEMTGRSHPSAMPFIMETDAGAAAIIRAMDERRRMAHFPWQISYLTKYVLASMPDFAYDWLAQKLSPFRAKRPLEDGRLATPRE